MGAQYRSGRGPANNRYPLFLASLVWARCRTENRYPLFLASLVWSRCRTENRYPLFLASLPSLRRLDGGIGRSVALCLDLVDRLDHRIESQQGGRMARLVVAHGLEHRDVGPFAVDGRGAVFLQHSADALAQAAQFVRFRPHDIARHDRG